MAYCRRHRAHGGHHAKAFQSSQRLLPVAARFATWRCEPTAAPPARTNHRELTMKAVVYDAPRQYAVKDIPQPEAGPGEVRIKVHQVGICGTDLHIHHGDFNAVFPLIPGHELVGTVDALGDGVTRFSVGE